MCAGLVAVIVGGRKIRGLIRMGSLVVRPFRPGLVGPNGLDLRLGRGYCRLRASDEPLDPLEPPEDLSSRYECGEADRILVGPGERLLLHTLEWIELPDSIAGLVNLRSTYARLGLVIPPTVVDAGFKGQLTIELLGSSFPVVLRAGAPFIHLILVEVDKAKPYKGKYQGQTGVTLPRLEGERPIPPRRA